MEINFAKILGLGALGAGCVYVGRLSNQAGVELQKADLVDEAKALESDVLLLMDANREFPGDMSHREQEGSNRLLTGALSRLKEFQEKNKPSPDKAADAINDGVDEGINVVGRVFKGVATVLRPWKWGKDKKKKEEKAETTAAAS